MSLGGNRYELPRVFGGATGLIPDRQALAKDIKWLGNERENALLSPLVS